MMMMMPRKTMAHIKTDPAAPATDAAQRAKFVKKVHKPPLGVNVINFELNWFMWVPWNPSDPKKSRSIQIHKKQAAFLHLF